jgi:hypothetical protein
VVDLGLLVFGHPCHGIRHCGACYGNSGRGIWAELGSVWIGLGILAVLSWSSCARVRLFRLVGAHGGEHWTWGARRVPGPGGIASSGSLVGTRHASTWYSALSGEARRTFRHRGGLGLTLVPALYALCVVPFVPAPRILPPLAFMAPRADLTLTARTGALDSKHSV